MSSDPSSAASRADTAFLNELPFTGPAAFYGSTAFKQCPDAYACLAGSFVSNDIMGKFVTLAWHKTEYVAIASLASTPPLTARVLRLLRRGALRAERENSTLPPMSALNYRLFSRQMFCFRRLDIVPS